MSAVTSSVSEILGIEKNLYLGRLYVSRVGGARLLAGDFDEDGNTNFLSNGHQTAIYFGRGDGRFPRIRELDAGGTLGSAVADLNGDTHLDLVLMTYGIMIATLLGTGDGAFGEPKIYPVDPAVSAMDVGDQQ